VPALHTVSQSRTRKSEGTERAVSQCARPRTGPIYEDHEGATAERTINSLRGPEWSTPNSGLRVGCKKAPSQSHDESGVRRAALQRAPETARPCTVPCNARAVVWRRRIGRPERSHMPGAELPGDVPANSPPSWLLLFLSDSSGQWVVQSGGPKRREVQGSTTPARRPPITLTY